MLLKLFHLCLSVPAFFLGCRFLISSSGEPPGRRSNPPRWTNIQWLTHFSQEYLCMHAANLKQQKMLPFFPVFYGPEIFCSGVFPPPSLQDSFLIRVCRLWPFLWPAFLVLCCCGCFFNERGTKEGTWRKSKQRKREREKTEERERERERESIK